MDSKRIRIALIKNGQRVVDLHRVTGISYNRLVRVLNGYCEPRPDEIVDISTALGVRVDELEADR